MANQGHQLGLLAKNIGFTMGRQAFGTIVGLATIVILARTLGPAGNGVYSLLILIPTFLANLVNLGISPANVYLIASGRFLPRTAYRASIAFGIAVSIITLILAAVAILTHRSALFPNLDTSLVMLSLIGFPVLLFHSYLASILQGLQDFTSLNKALLAPSFLTLLFSATLVFFLGYGITGAMVAFLLGNQIALGYTFFLVRKRIQTTQTQEVSSLRVYMNECFAYGWKTHASNTLTFVNYRIDLYLISAISGAVSTGLYSISIQIAEKIWIVSQSVSAVILPRLSELRANDAIRKELTPLVARWVFAVTVFVAVIVVLVGFPVISVMFGPEYADAYPALVYLLPGIVLGSFARVFANDIAARGEVNLNLYVALIIAVVNIIANLLLIPIWGIIGAAIATSIAYSMNACLKLIIYSRLTGQSTLQVVLPNHLDWHVLKTLRGIIEGSSTKLRLP